MKWTRRHNRICWIVSLIIVSAAILAGVAYALIDYYSNPEQSDPTATETTTSSKQTTSPTCDFDASVTQSHPITNFETNDALEVPFAHGANTIQEMEDALFDDRIKMIEGDITLRYYGTPNATEEPIMAHPPEFDSDNTLKNWLYNILISEKGPKLDIKVEEVIPYALQELQSQSCLADQPVWINADVLQGPNSFDQPISAETLIKNVNEYFPNLTLSLGWTTGYRQVGVNEQYSWESMDTMMGITQTTHQPVTFPVRAILARDSWDRFLWLVDQDEERFTFTIWSASTDPVDLADKMFIRDNFNPARVYYDTTGTFAEDIEQELLDRTMPKVFYTGGNVLDYYEITDRNAMKITWAHAVNSVEELNEAVADDNVLMLEADVRSYGEGTPSLNTSVPVMAHDPGVETLNAITFEEWLDVVISNSTKGIKLDFKSLGSVQPSLDILNSRKDELNIPIWLNADILRGPNLAGTPVNASEFLRIIDESFPHATISPGWTTAYNYAPDAETNRYTQEMVEEMYAAVKDMRQAITFPVRASLTHNSIVELQWLLKQSDRYSLTIWQSTAEDVTTEELMKIYNGFAIHKVFYDIPQEMMDPFLEEINNL